MRPGRNGGARGGPCARGTGGARGLRPDGTIAREGGLDRVQAPFAPVVAAARTRIAAAFPAEALHSAYLYGSVPRGTARPGRSDLDLLLALHRAPDAQDHARARELESGLDRDFAQIDGVGVLLAGAAELLSERERHDLGWFVACLCTPLLGADLGALLPGYRPTSLLARESNGDLAEALERWRTRAAGLTTDAGLRTLLRGAARKTVRTGFSLVMPRWQGWTSDLEESAEIFGAHYPRYAARMREAAEAARYGDGGTARLTMLTEELGPWLAAEHLRVHGARSPRT